MGEEDPSAAEILFIHSEQEHDVAECEME